MRRKKMNQAPTTTSEVAPPAPETKKSPEKAFDAIAAAKLAVESKTFGSPTLPNSWKPTAGETKEIGAHVQPRESVSAERTTDTDFNEYGLYVRTQERLAIEQGIGLVEFTVNKGTKYRQAERTIVVDRGGGDVYVGEFVRDFSSGEEVRTAVSEDFYKVTDERAKPYVAACSTAIESILVPDPIYAPLV